MAKQKTVELMPPAALEAHPNDVPLTMEQFLTLGFFTRLKSKPNPDKFPGTLALRRFRKGEEICRQGEAGWTAFWTLPSADALATLQGQLVSTTGAGEKRPLQEEISALQKRITAQAGKPEQDPTHAVATVYLAIARPQDPKPGVFQRVGALFSRRRTNDNRPLFVPIDGPTDINYATQQATIWEGDLFGEMSCMYGSPRSATVVADDDCYVLEMLRNILDKAQKDANFQKETDRIYRQRVLQAHLQGLPIFRELTDAQFAGIRDRLELLRCEDGHVICKEGDPSDCMYLIRSGLVKVMRNAPPQPGPAIILAYCGKGEFIGEMGVMTGAPRSATCVAYVHPEPGAGAAAGVWRREAKQVELVRIPLEVFRELVQLPTVKQQVEKVIAERRGRNEARGRQPLWEEGKQLLQSQRADELGLVQGQRLMLIDLDRCTRCDECVQACVDTHTDGRSRLFLDGPRFGKYLVPATCRACLDPVCMIGCPVGAIHRGDNKQIVIEDWCIGCEVCAKNCPYGSIQMHDLGIIPEAAYGWRYCTVAQAGDGWQEPDYRDRHWLAGRAPFTWSRELQRALGYADSPAAVCFRYHFSLDAARVRSAPEFRLELTSTDNEAFVWVNGQEQKPLDKPKRGKREYALPRSADVLFAGRNVIAVMATPMPGSTDELLALRLDEVQLPAVPAGLAGEFSEKLVTLRAVVCDLCSSQHGQRPACVTACPHDAAIRVEARAVLGG